MTRRRHAVVIGGSLAGLATAAALARHMDAVTVVDRDTFPGRPGRRRGLPQGQHLHALMVSGRRALEDLLPGLTDDLVKAGAVEVGAPRDNLWLSAAGWCTRFPATHVVPSASRDLLDWVLRRRVAALVGVRLRQGYDVVELLADRPDEVVGVRMRSHDGRVEECRADLVVDASGRSTKTPTWLRELGYETPRRSVVDSRAGYSSRFYRIPTGFDGDWRCISIGNQPPRTTRGGALIQVEGDRWIVSLFGYLGDHPPTDEDGFLTFAASLRHPVLHDTIARAMPAGPVHGFRSMASQRWHFEELPKWPERFVVVGDAACTLNPVYAQGMSVAAVSATALDRWLSVRDGEPGGCAVFQRELGGLIDWAWGVAVGADSAVLALAEDSAATAVADDVGFGERMLQAAMVDPVVNAAFFDVMMMVASPESLASEEISRRIGQGPPLPGV